MAEKKSRPVPKRRSVYTEAGRNDDYSTTDLYGTVQDPKTNTRAKCGPKFICFRLAETYLTGQDCTVMQSAVHFFLINIVKVA